LKLTTPKNEKVFYLDGSLGESIDASSTKNDVDYNPAGEEHLLKHLEVLTKDHIISPFSFLLSNGGFIEITSLFMNNVNT